MDRRGPPPGAGGGRSFLSLKIDEKKRMQESVSGHRTGLPPALLRHFEARPPLPPHKAPPAKPRKVPYSGVAQYLEHFAAPGDAEYEPPAPETRPSEPRVFVNPELPYQSRLDLETKLEKDIRLRQERQQGAAQQHEDGLKSWDPTKDPNVAGDPFKTLFVGRLSYDVTERKLRREFEEYGPIKSIRLVHDKNSGKPRGYAFIEYEHKNDMKQAYKMADGRKVEDRRVLVDVERGRTVPNWRPRRLGGGKGGESRLIARPPKGIKRQFVSRILERAIAEKEQQARKESEREERPLERSREWERPVEDGRRERERRTSEGRGDRDRVDGEREGRPRDYDRDRKRDRDDRGERGYYDRGSDAKRPRERDL